MDFLLDRFATVPQHVAVVHGQRRLTYGQLLQQVHEYTQWLSAQGIFPGQVVAILGDYSPEMFFLLLALVQNGNVLVPLAACSAEQAACLQVSEAQVLLTVMSDGGLDCQKLSDLPPQNPLIKALREANQSGLILFSSGTSGKPKGIVHSFARLLERFRQPRQPSVAIAFLALDHFGGINTLLAITSSLGTVVTIPDRSVSAICQAISLHRVETLPTTPSFLNMLVHSGSHAKYDLSSLRLITYGTEVMPAATLHRLQKAFPAVKLKQTYGLSELGVFRSHSREDGSLWVKLGGEGFETKVLQGILWVRSDYAMLGYLNEASPFDREGWFCTEDRVETDGDYLRILGRVTDLINVAGQKVNPAEVEGIILEMDNIVDVSVRAEPSPLVGNLIVAEVVLGQAESLISLKQRIRKACSSQLASFKWPAKVKIAEQDLFTERMKKKRSNP